MTKLAHLACCLLPAAAFAADDALLLHYSFDEGQGAVAGDSSANMLAGKAPAAWAPSPSGQAMAMDGTGQTVVSVSIPEPLRFGKQSWTFSAWLKPQQLTIDDRQNQRRLFAFGTYPDAYLVIDLFGDGHVGGYYCYKGADGKVVSMGSGSGYKLEVGQWAHIAVSFDREARQVVTFINGFLQGTSAMPANFDGDFSLSGELTFGNGWHNYWGLMDEVTVLRRAWSKEDAKAEFNRLRETFAVELSPELALVEQREALMQSFASVSGLWSKRDFAAVRAACTPLLGRTELAPNLRSYAHLRIAQSYRAEGKLEDAAAEYGRIAATADYPQVHRLEAAVQVGALKRQAAGQPARDPLASRTQPAALTNFAIEVFVAPAGKDTNPGTQAAPVATLTKARDLLRAWRATGQPGNAAITMLPGEYRLTAPVELTAEDSGTPERPVLIRAAEPGRTTFYGGVRLTDFQREERPEILARLPENARGKVANVDLAAAGITDYGQLAVRGFGQAASPPTLELFVNGRPMTVSRWPNEGFVGISKLIEPGDKSKNVPSIFEYQDDRPARWTKAEDPWLFGYFRFLWADATIQVSKIDPVAKTMTFDTAYHYGRPGMDTGQGIQWYAFNLLEEIDQPGEWYLDRSKGVLYFWPPTDLADATVEIGLLSTPMLTMDGVSDVRIEGLTFDLGRFNGLEARDCHRILIAGCTVSRMAGNGVMIHGGTGNGLLGCDIHTIGRRASEVIGGDRETLTPGRHFVENCNIHNFGRIDRTYTPAIQLEGVGHRVAHNQMYACPSSVMRIEGNDHLIEYNEVYNAVSESDDQGAMELFRNATYRGVVFRYNRYTNCGKAGRGAAVHGQAAIRFDDAISGMLVYGNVFIRSANGNFGAIQMNSGRDNIMDNNLFIDCKQGISGGWNAGNSVWKMLREGNQPPEFFTNELYLTRYPQIATMLDEPALNHLWRNVFYRCGQMARSNMNNIDNFANQQYDDDPGFGEDYAIQPDSPLLADVGFEPIPVDEIGLYQSPYRASWPVAKDIQPIPDWRETGGH